MNESDTISSMKELQHPLSANRPLYLMNCIPDDTIIQYKRKRVRDHVLNFLNPNSHILELNAGTGEDAIFFAQQGHTVHATDISDVMQAKLLKEKAKQYNLQKKISAMNFVPLPIWKIYPTRGLMILSFPILQD